VRLEARGERRYLSHGSAVRQMAHVAPPPGAKDVNLFVAVANSNDHRAPGVQLVVNSNARCVLRSNQLSWNFVPSITLPTDLNRSLFRPRHTPYTKRQLGCDRLTRCRRLGAFELTPLQPVMFRMVAMWFNLSRGVNSLRALTNCTALLNMTFREVFSSNAPSLWQRVKRKTHCVLVLIPDSW